ncbi:lycopene beta-cyclase [Salinibacterium sp. CAN_S4]|uniref:lycopene cyclase family protein n=1 Tax=Salinibacterium sp. CAN_S4 TaxID=2787727 RepID=UPI0018EFFCFB
MPSDHDVDLVILGGGCAGLSLAARLADARTGLTVVVLEARTGYVDDRSWCFWRPEQHDLSHLVSKSWSSWTFRGADGRTSTRAVPGLRYQYIRGSDFYADALQRIATSSSVSIRTGVRVSTVEPEGNGLRVQTDSGEFTPRWVVDTRPRRLPAMLYQCFAGVEIESDSPLPFDLDEAGLMTGMRSDADGLGFTYILPLTATSAIIEWTRFSARPLPPAELAAGLAAVLDAKGLASARVIRNEGGVLPMGRPPAVSASVPGVVLAGMGGGALRAASGYAFLRIQGWAETCAAELQSGRAPVGHPAEPWDRREMDRIFLQAIRARPEKTGDYFLRLAGSVPPERLVRFLSDQATVGDYARIIASLPLLPFLAQIPRRPELFLRTEEVAG